MTSHDQEVDLEVAKKILRYFNRDRKAADTIEGVARWRLLDQEIHESLETVRRAMDWLVSRGFLVREASSFISPVYRLNAEGLEEIARFLEQKKRNNGPAKH